MYLCFIKLANYKQICSYNLMYTYKHDIDIKPNIHSQQYIGLYLVHICVYLCTHVEVYIVYALCFHNIVPFTYRYQYKAITITNV